MIKNFIFDFGNVLVDYNPMRCILKYVRNISDANYIAAEVFSSPEWLELDKGNMSYEEAIGIWQSRVPERLKESVRTVVENFHKYLPEIPEMTAIVKRLRNSGKKIYIISNVSERFSMIAEGIEVMNYVDGRVLSFEEHTIKPETEIFSRLLSRYSLTAEECVFIDDSINNVRTAKKFGMGSYIYDGDSEKLEKTFEKLGFFQNIQ